MLQPGISDSRNGVYSIRPSLLRTSQWPVRHQPLSYLEFGRAGNDFIDVFAGLGSNGDGISKTAEKSKRAIFPGEAGTVGGAR